MLTYGPTGRSRGTATIIFVKAGSAAQAAHELNGVKVDNAPYEEIARKLDEALGA